MNDLWGVKFMERKKCPKCGSDVESDNFCLKCMEFVRPPEEKTESPVTENDDNTLEKDSYFNNVGEDTLKTARPQLEVVDKERNNPTLKRYLMAFIAMAGIIFVGIYILSTIENSDYLQTYGKSVVSTEGSQYEVEDEISLDDGEEAYETTDNSDSDYVITDVSYEDVIAEGKSSTFYYLYDIMANDIVAEINDYIHLTDDSEISYDDEYTDNYKFTFSDGSEYTCYESYNIWNYEDGTGDVFYLMRDTVTGHLMGIGVRCLDFNRASGLVIKAMELVEGPLSDEDKEELLQQLEIYQKVEQEESFYYHNQIIYGSQTDGYVSYDIYLNGN